MQLLTSALPYIQIILSVILVTSVLLQQSGAGVGGAFGGGDSSLRYTRRGFEKFLFILSIICGILFVLSAIFSIMVNSVI
ncbi:MAG: preprotein translocase subunit SecG [Candidatus Paceibacterota bacterium]|jgi:protein translocase SecG subunit